MIEKWIRLQSEDSDQSIREAVDRREEELNSILRRNVVPALPGHVLLVLQSLESISISKTELTSYGHCYNLMIVAALGKAGVKPFELDTYINVLTELSYAMHVLGIRAIEERELVAFFISYRKSFLAPNIDDLVRTLIDSGLMRRENGGYVVYRYVSGYFAGRYIAEALSNNDAAHKRLSFLADNAHNDDCALVLLFVCHHTKNPAAMETILLNLMVALDTFPASKLAREEFEPLADILNSLPQAMLLAEPIAVARERISAREEDSNRVACEIDDISLELEPSGALARLLRAVKALEITGQLVRNRHGSLPVDQLHQLVSEAITCAQRVAGFILEMSRGMKDELPELIATMRREHPKLSSEKIESDLRGFLMFICHFSLHGLLRLVSQQLTNDALKPLVLDVLKDRQDDFSLLLQAHIKLKLEDQAVVREMQDLVPTLGKNSFTFSLLQHAVADRLQLFDIPYDDKQRIAEMFKIGVPTQVALNQPTFGRRK